MDTARLHEEEYVFVCAPNRGGEMFVRKMEEKNQPFFVLAQNEEQHQIWRARGYDQVREINALDIKSMMELFEYPVSKVVLFEDGWYDCCSLIRTIRVISRVPIYVITSSKQPTSSLYYSLGATYVIHSHTADVSFLLV